MPWLPLYVDEIDASRLLAILNADPEIAFIVSSGRGRWVAQQGIQSVTDSRYCLWHVPSGALPLVRGAGVPDGVISNPWTGWTEVVPGADPRVPFFGSPPGVVWWNVQTHSARSGGIGLSSFEWIGNRYRTLGDAAHPATEAWWKKLRKTVRQMPTVRIPRSGPFDGPKPEIWALPSAFDKIRAGAARDENPR